MHFAPFSLFRVNQEKMKRQRETILPPSSPRGPPPVANRRAAAAANTHGKNAIRVTQSCKLIHLVTEHHFTSNGISIFLWLVIVSPLAGPYDAESHERLAQRIEKDVVSFDIHCGGHHCPSHEIITTTATCFFDYYYYYYSSANPQLCPGRHRDLCGTAAEGSWGFLSAQSTQQE